MRTSFPVPLGASLLAAVVGLGCLVAPRPACSPPQASERLQVAVEARSNNGLIADATVRLPQAAPIYLEYGNDQAGWLRTPLTGVGVDHWLPIFRLRPANTYQVHAFLVDEAGCPSEAASAQLRTGELPADFRGLGVQASGRSTSPLIVTDVHSAGFVALDNDGQPVWFHLVRQRTGTTPARSNLHGLVQLDNGNLLYLIKDFGLEEMTPDGQPVRRIRMDDSHHEVFDLHDGRVLVLTNQVRVIDDSRNGGRPAQKILGDVIQRVDLQTGSKEAVWKAFDVLDPTQRLSDSPDSEGVPDNTIDWTHTNSLSFGARGNLVISVRNLNQVISLSPDLRTIEWKLGGPGSSFSFLDETDRFYAQHTASELPNGRILVFDNGFRRPEEDYSRALELELDFQTMAARKVWEYRHQPDLYSQRVSGAMRLENGNTLVHFGLPRDPDGPVMTVEATPEGRAQSVLEVQLKGQRTTSYRAYPLSSLAGEVAVKPTAIAAR